MRLFCLKLSIWAYFFIKCYMRNIFQNLFSPIKRNKGLFVFLLIGSIVMIVLAIVAAFRFDNGVLVLDLENVSYVLFLKGDTGFMGYIFRSLLSICIVYALIFLCCSKKFLLPLSIIFFLYHVYSQAVILTTLILLYGFFNVFILFLFLLVFVLAEILMLLILLICFVELAGDSSYFKSCFSPAGGILLTTILLLLLDLLFCLVIIFLKSFVLLLIF